MKKERLRWIILIVLALIWGSSFILIKKALIGLTPVQVGALRVLITSITLLIIGFKSLWLINKKQWFYITITAFVGVFFPAFLFSFAITNIDSSVASILNSLTPLNTLTVGILFFSYSFKKHKLTGVVIGLIGTVLLIYKGTSINTNQNYWYALLPVIASIGYAFNVNILKKHLSDISALSITTGNFVLLIIPSLLVLYFSNFHTTFQFDQTTYLPLLYLTILAIVGTAYAHLLFNRLIKISSPLFSSSVTYLIPVIAVILGLMDGEYLSLIQFTGGVLILLGVYFTNRR